MRGEWPRFALPQGILQGRLLVSDACQREGFLVGRNTPQPTGPRFHPGAASCPVALGPPAPEPKMKVKTQPPLMRRGKNEGVGEEKLNRNLGPMLTGDWMDRQNGQRGLMGRWVSRWLEQDGWRRRQ